MNGNLLTRVARAGRLLVLVVSLPLGGCALANIGGGPAPQLFTLTAAHPAMPEAMPVKPMRIEVDEFSAPAAIDTARIVQQSSPNEIAYYADARWTDRAPRMIRNLMIETFENAGRFGAVSAEGAGLLADYELTGDIRQFAVIPSAGGGKAEVRVEFFARLVHKDERTVLASKLFSAAMPVEGSGLTPIVTAYDGALRQVLDGMALWTAAETGGGMASAAPKP